MSQGSLLFIIISTALIDNVVLSQFLGICSFLGVSKSLKNSVSLGAAVILVISVSSAVANLLYTFILKPLDLTYLDTIVFILVIAALVQMVEMFIKKSSSLQGPGHLSSADHHQLRCSRCCPDKRSE